MSYMPKAERTDWNTPANIVEVVRRIGDGVIDLDPCHNESSVVRAEVGYKLPDFDGLALPWHEWPLTYVNPPYGREIGDWIAKCHAEARKGPGEIVALLPARTDTSWFDLCWRADAICFVRGRLTFLGAPSAAPFSSCLVYWGRRAAHFEAETKHLGKVVRP